MPVLTPIAEITEEMTAWRRDLHAHPELGFQEHRTSDFVAHKLESWGIEVTRGIAKTGLVGTLRNGSSARAIAIRADMDALPMEEANDFPHRSRHRGTMHACGHDGHTTMLLGAARYLSLTRNFDGVVHFIFQPAEEGLGGGRVMVEEGLFERFPCEAVYGAHNDTHLPVGTVAAVRGPVSAASDRFSIRIRGRGGHAARPHRSIDPVLIGAHVVLALQSIVARRVDPRESAVLSVTQFHSGSAGNVIPEEAVLSGTVRTLEPHVQSEVQRLLENIASSTVAAHGAEAHVSYAQGYPPVVNAPEPTERAALAATRLLGEDKVVRKRRRGMGGEDFSFMALKVPGCFLRIGQAETERGRTPVHNPRYDFNDAILPIGASLWATLVEQELPQLV
jgi:amidohydrolase